MLTLPMQNLVLSVLQAITVPHLLRSLAVQDITAKLQRLPAAFVQVGLNVLEVEQVTPCVLKASMLATVVRLVHRVTLVITVLSMAHLNQSSVQLATSLTKPGPASVSSAQLATTVTHPPRLLVTPASIAMVVRPPVRLAPGDMNAWVEAPFHQSVVQDSTP